MIAARSIPAIAVIAAIHAAASIARAEDKTAALDAPAPPTLPALAHASLTYTFELTTASIKPTGTPEGDRATAWFAHNELELPLKGRQWYLGAAHDIAAGAVPGVGHDFFLGNPEIWARGLWSSVVGLSSGGGLGIVLPLPRSPSDEALKILETVSVVRPWDSAYFTDRVLTLRPWFDIRHVVGRFIFQLRQGLDAAFPVHPLKPNDHRVDYTARATLYVGFRATQTVGLGLEAWEVYQLTANVSDDKRAATTISPSIRLILGRVAPAISVLLPIATPLRGQAASYYAARLNVGFDFDIGKPVAGP